jgi:hypothetical protein
MSTQVVTQAINGPSIEVPVAAGLLTITWQAADPTGNFFYWDNPNGDILLVWNTGSNPIGTAGDYAILGASAVTNSDGASTVISGGLIGSYPTNTITPGSPNWTLTNGAAVTTALAQNQTDLANSITLFQAMGPGTVIASALDSQTLTPGVYSFSSGAATLSGGTLTLNGAGQYIILMASTLTLTGASQIVLENGATANNVFFVCGSSMTAAANSGTLFNGNILAVTSITVDGGVYNGSLLANNGAVTISTATAIYAQPSSATAQVTLTSTPDDCNMRLGDITDYSIGTGANGIMAFNFASYNGWGTFVGPSPTSYSIAFTVSTASALVAVIRR